jgi:hypothetical protein
MSHTTIYEYTAKDNGGGAFTVDTGTQVSANATISELSPGDQFAFGGKIYTYTGGADTGGSEVGFFATDPSGKERFFSTTPLSGPGKVHLTLNTSQDYTICFMAGTRIATPNGFAKVEDLAIGDPIVTADGGVAPVRWVGRQTISTVFGDPNRVLPIRVKAGALEENLPARDLLLSPCHAILLDGVLVQAAALVNGTSIVRETSVPQSFVYYHVELDDHALLRAEDVPAETFIDNVDRLAFDNWQEHQALYPNGRSISEMAYPRASSARQVPPAIARKLEARARVIAPAAKDAA